MSIEKEQVKNMQALTFHKPATSLNQAFRQGLRDEKMVIDWLVRQGHHVEDSTEAEDKYDDIDCWVNGKSYSIKAQHRGLLSGNVGFELASQLTTHQNCQLTQELLPRLNDDPRLGEKMIERLVASGTWEYGWLINGKAEYYLILRGHHLHMYKKSHVLQHIAKKGFRKVLPLSAAVKATQGGKYRYCNTVSGYINTSDVVNRIFVLLQVDIAC